MAATSPPTKFADVHPHIIQTHILPRLDGLSLSAATTASSYLQNLCNDDNLWSGICNSTWPSITDPRVDEIISTFPDGHRSFFEDSFPTLITEDNRRPVWSNRQSYCLTTDADRSSHPGPPELISAVDIRYGNDIVYSTVKVTDTTNNFLPSALWIELNEYSTSPRSGPRPVPGISRPIDLKVDELLGADDATLTHLKETVTLNWILIDPIRKRAGNLSSIKPLLVRKDWMTNDIHIRYVTVLPGYDPNEMVQCRIQVTCAVGKAGVGLHVREVVLQIQDLDYGCVTGKEFLVITQRAILEENNVRRRNSVGDEEIERRYKEFKQMRRVKMEWVKKEEQKRELSLKVNYILVFVYFILSVYYVSMLL